MTLFLSGCLPTTDSDVIKEDEKKEVELPSISPGGDSDSKLITNSNTLSSSEILARYATTPDGLYISPKCEDDTMHDSTCGLYPLSEDEENPGAQQASKRTARTIRDTRTRKQTSKRVARTIKDAGTCTSKKKGEPSYVSTEPTYVSTGSIPELPPETPETLEVLSEERI